jgi:hypothetical protein
LQLPSSLNQTRYTNTHLSNNETQKVIITHPFHPLYKQEFVFVDKRYIGSEHRVYFYNKNEKLVSVPVSWTNYASDDPFIRISEGKALFRAEDLLGLHKIIRNLKENRYEKNKEIQ